MSRIRILVVDDSAVIRKLLCDTLSADPDIEVVGTAGDGRIAISKVAKLKPDVVTLDIEMPVMDGLEALKELRKAHPALPIIMFSTLTERGAAATLDALSWGATDYVTKPSNTNSIQESAAAVRAELVPKIKALAWRVRPEDKTPEIKSPLPKPEAPRSHRVQPIEIVAIGTSTGGPNALSEVLGSIPKDFPVPIVIVQHMPPIFTRFLAERLGNHCQIKVSEGPAGADLAAGHAWIAPGGFHMTIVRAGLRLRLELNQDPPENSCRPSVDVMFRSVAAVYGASVLGVVMTGMGKDGVDGARHIRDVGGEVIVQDQSTAVVWGMPGLVFEAGLADGVYPLHQLAAEINRRVAQSRLHRGGPPLAISAARSR